MINCLYIIHVFALWLTIKQSWCLCSFSFVHPSFRPNCPLIYAPWIQTWAASDDRLSHMQTSRIRLYHNLSFWNGQWESERGMEGCTKRVMEDGWRYIDYEKDWNNSTENTCRLCCTVHMFTCSRVVLLSYIMCVVIVFPPPKSIWPLLHPFLFSSPRVFMLFVVISNTGSHLLCSVTSFSLSCSSPTTFNTSLFLPPWIKYSCPSILRV